MDQTNGWKIEKDLSQLITKRIKVNDQQSQKTFVQVRQLDVETFHTKCLVREREREIGSSRAGLTIGMR